MSGATRKREEVYDQVVSAVAQVLAIPRESIRPDSRYLEDLGATSLDRATLYMVLEEDLKLTLPESTAAALVTIDQTVDFILQNLPTGREPG
jgi:acyl carrier protein